MSKSLTPGKGDSFKAHFERLSLIENKFDEVQDLIEFYNIEVDDPKLTLETVEVYSSFINLVDAARNNYFQYTIKMKVDPSPHVNQSQSLQLPRIPLPTFSGNIDEWSEFYSLFTSLVDNDPSLSDTNKFQYLRTSLKGKALAVISQLEFIPENYSLAKEALKLRFENKRRLATLYLNKITNFKFSGHNFDCGQFLSVLETNWNALEKLRIPDLKDFLKLELSLSKLDPATRRVFENQNVSETFPTYESLIKFLTSNVKVDDPPSHSDKSRKNQTDSINKNSKSRSYYVPENTSSPQSHKVFALESPSKAQSDSTEKENKAEKTNNNKQSKNFKRNQGTSPKENSPQAGHSQNVEGSHGLRCWNCGGPHVYSVCKEPRKRFCYKCGTQGALISNCPKCNPVNLSGTQRRGSL